MILRPRQLGAAALALTVCAVSGEARALEWDELSAGGTARYDMEWVGAMTEPLADVRYQGERYRDRVTGGLAARAMAGAPWIQLAAALDFRLGATDPAAFAYAFHLRPLGFAFGSGEILRLSSTFGVGFDGAAPQLPFAVRLPLDGLLEIPAGDHLRFDLGAEAAWIATPSDRRDGSDAIGFADEVAACLRIRIGDRYEQWSRLDAGNGYFFGVALEQRLGLLYAGASFGYALDGSYLGG